MIYELAQMEDLQTVYDVVQHTIKTIYPKYYPAEVVDFFCEHHSREAIAKDIENGYVSVLKIDGNIVATGCFVDQHITRVYVLPEYQKKGYGTFIMKSIEAQIGDKYDKAYLDASLPAAALYEKLGFSTIKHERYPVENGVILAYEVMEKQLHKVTDLQPWECLMKRIVWKQLGDIHDKKILDFGSGIGVTANYLAENNDVTAIEPDVDSIKERWADNQYTQIAGSTDELRKFADETFDMIICHNVLEYAQDREDIVKEFARILKSNGKISIVKHNRAGRVMQMVVLLNDFEHAHSLLDGNDGMASKYGAIRYYEDVDIEKWCSELAITKTMGMRTFWDMQQNQELHKDADWQDKMVEIEMRVSDMDGYKDIAFFHHLMIERRL